MKTLILLFYYNRPVTALNALNSVFESDYQDWELAIVDDGSSVPLVDLRIETDPRVTYYRIGDTQAQKEAQGGSRHGQWANMVIEKSSADIVVILCDDDALHRAYLGNLNKLLKEHPEIIHCFSDVILFDPTRDDYHSLEYTPVDRTHFLNSNTNAQNCFNSKDASQVAWRRSCGPVFPSPQTVALDAVIWNHLYYKYGNAVYTGFVSQYKGDYPHQLGKRGSTYGKTEPE